MDLFTGIGGFSLGLKLAFGPEYRTVCYVENDGYCLQVLKARIADGFLDDAPVWDDISTFEGTPWRGCVDIITAGFPCQPFSVAGKRKGKDDERNLWPNLRRVISEVEPRYVLLENVPGLLALEYFGTILGELAEVGHDAKWDCLPASTIGANHQRDRLWIMAYPNSERLSQFLSPGKKQQGRPRLDWIPVQVDWGTSNPAETFIRRGLPGIPCRVDRIKALGNSIVPAVVPEFLRRVS